MDPSGRKLHGSLNLDHEGTRPTLPGEGKPLRKRRKEEGLESSLTQTPCQAPRLGEHVYVQAHTLTCTCTHIHKYATWRACVCTGSRAYTHMYTHASVCH